MLFGQAATQAPQPQHRPASMTFSFNVSNPSFSLANIAHLSDRLRKRNVQLGYLNPLESETQSPSEHNYSGLYWLTVYHEFDTDWSTHSARYHTVFVS